MSYDIQADLVPYRPCQPSPKIATTTVPPTYEGSLCTTEVAQHRVDRMAGENTWVRVDGEHSSIWAQVKVRGVWQDLRAIGMLVVSEGTIETRIGAGPITSDLLENLSLSCRHQVLGEDMCSDDLLDNHTRADAATLPASGELCGEPDWFEIDAPAGDRVTLDLSGDTSAQMTVVDADGNTLTAGQQHIQLVAPAGGAWLRLDASDSHEPWGTPYSVTVHHEPWSSLPGWMPWCAGDEHWYRVMLSADEAVSVRALTFGEVELALFDHRPLPAHQHFEGDRRNRGRRRIPAAGSTRRRWPLVACSGEGAR